MQIRYVDASDLEALADLMLDAYRGTIDYEGEDLQGARKEVEAYLNDKPSIPLLGCSWTCWSGAILVSAILIRWSSDRKLPLVAYIMTRVDWKNHGLATALLRRALHCLSEQGYSEARTTITVGNMPSEHMFNREGFKRA